MAIGRTTVIVRGAPKRPPIAVIDDAEGRSDYSAIGTVVNLAARLCAEAGDGHILVDSKVRTAIEDAATLEPAGDFVLKGLHRRLIPLTQVPLYVVSEAGRA